MSLRLLLCLALLALVPSWVDAQQPPRPRRQEALIVFKDGFYITGKVVEKRDVIFDPTGAHVSIPLQGGLITLDDYVRRIFFIPGQLQDVLKKKEFERDVIELTRPKYVIAPKNFMRAWELDSVTPWNEKWERTLSVTFSGGNGPSSADEMTQRIVEMTPQYMYIQTGKWNWDLFYQTKEFGYQEVRGLLNKYYSTKKEVKDFDKRLQIAKFLFQVGWHLLAEKELDNLATDYPTQQDPITSLRTSIKKVQADLAAENIERMFKVGQYEEVQDRLAAFAKDNLAAHTDPKNLLVIEDLKNKSAEGREKLAKVRSLLKVLPERLTSSPMFWKKQADLILDELHFDTQGRLETFAVFAQQHLRELDDKQKPTQTTEQVLALAVTGWLQGNAAAEPDPKMARMLLRARAMILEHQKAENPVARNQMVATFLKDTKDGEVPIDVLARLIRLLPPPVPFDKAKLDTGPMTIDIEAPDSNGGSYVVQLPPEYHHGRAYPVLMVLHAARETPTAALKRWSELAAMHGFILLAPSWGGGFNPTYGYSAKEHAAVLDSLRDLRRRFQVDSDRVFLFGFEQGAEAALDIGMAHPDHFAGVLPMCFHPRYYPEKCWSNAQFVHMYLVDGDRSGNSKANRDLFKEWVRGVYPALYIEYKGRSFEFYTSEMPTMFDWMSRKKRYFPNRDLGRYSGNSSVVGEEFKTMRPGYQRFYWLSTDAVNENNINSINAWSKTIRPAFLQGNISTGNELKGGKDAKIWNHVNIRTSGVKNVTLWLTPAMVDFTKPTLIRVNSTQHGIAKIIPPNPTVLLEDFNYWADRQRLYFAKVELRP